MPEWLPGTGFKRTARKWNKTFQEAVNKPFDFVKLQLVSLHIKESLATGIADLDCLNVQASGNALLSFVGGILDEGLTNKVDEEELRYAAVTLYGAGADTVCFLLPTAVDQHYNIAHRQ